MSPHDVETNAPFSPLGGSLLVRANEGRTFFRGAHSVVILLDGKQTGEKFTTLLLVVHRAAARGRITTTVKTSGSISSKVGLVFSGRTFGKSVSYKTL
jgi:hypothetical protein